MIIPSWPTVPINRTVVKEGLDQTQAILKELDNLHTKLPLTIHIAGTNGKGSTLAMLRNIYRLAGYKVHSYSSPHIMEYNERIFLAERFITDEYINDLILRTKAACDQIEYEPTFFEGTTAMAFLAFAENPADILILETGLGGRLDCTNVIEDPAATIITSISYDHMEYLGNTIESIVGEKAGIMKINAPCIIGAQSDQVSQILFDHAKEKNIDVLAYEYDYGITINDQGFGFHTEAVQLQFPKPGLKGEHQYRNCAAAIATILTLNNKLPVSNNIIGQGIASTKWPGRLEEIEYERRADLLPQNIDLFLDGAHNRAGSEALAKWLSCYDKPILLILGMTKNRDPVNFLEPLKEHIQQGLTVMVESEPSSYESEQLAKMASKIGVDFKHQYTLIDCLEYIKEQYKDQEIGVIVTGSLFLIGDCYKILTKNLKSSIV